MTQPVRKCYSEIIIQVICIDTIITVCIRCTITVCIVSFLIETFA